VIRLRPISPFSYVGQVGGGAWMGGVFFFGWSEVLCPEGERLFVESLNS
jgi:hypothetical protein